MPIKLLSAAAILAVLMATPVFACEQHKSHVMQTTAEAAPVIVVPEAAALLPRFPVAEEKAILILPEQAEAYGGYRGRGEKTVYLTN